MFGSLFKAKSTVTETELKPLSSANFSKSVEIAKQRSEKQISAFCDLILNELRGQEISPQLLGRTIKNLLNDDVSMLVVSEFSEKNARYALSAEGREFLGDKKAQLLETNIKLTRSLIALDICNVIDLIAPNSEWKKAIGDISISDAPAKKTQAVDRAICLERFIKVATVIKESDQRLNGSAELSSASLFSEPKHGYGQIEPNGAVGISISPFSIAVQTPWGEMPVILGKDVSKLEAHLVHIFGLQPAELPIDMKLFSGMGNEKYYSVTKIPGESTQFPAAHFLEQHQRQPASDVEKEFNQLQGKELNQAVDQKKLGVMMDLLNESIVSADEIKQSEALSKIVAEFGASASGSLIPILARSDEVSSRLVSQLIEVLDKFSRDEVTREALKSNFEPVAAFIEKEHLSGEPGYKSYALWKLVQRIAPDGADRFLPLMIRDLDFRKSPQWTLQTFGYYGSAAKDCLPKLREYLNSQDYWSKSYAQESIAAIEIDIIKKASLS